VPWVKKIIDSWGDNFVREKTVTDNTRRQLAVRRIRCSYPELLAETLSQVRAATEDKWIQIDHEYCGPAPETILTDSARATEALAALVIGAIRLSETDTFCLLTRLLRDAKPEMMLRFDVIDPITRIGDDRLARLFHPVAQADDSGNEEFQRPESAFSRVKRLARALGGTVTAAPLFDGTRYRLTIAAGKCDDPRLRSQRVTRQWPKPETSVRPHNSRVDCRVLLVEDNEDHQPLLSTILRKAGSQVTIADNGQVAMELVAVARQQGRPFGIILMDMQMPVLDGLTTTRMLRSSGVTSPIIAVTARAMASERQQCLDAGCNDFVSKPIDRWEFVQRLASYVNRSSLPAHPDSC